MIESISLVYKKFKYGSVFRKEYDMFLQTQKFSQKGYKAFRKMFVLTKGKSNDMLSKEIAEKNGKYDSIPEAGILKNIDGTILNQFRKEGFYVFNDCLDEKQIQSILDYATVTPVSYMNTSNNLQEYSKDKVVFNENEPISPRYQFTNEEILKCSTLQELTFDYSLLKFAQEYLGCKPILDLVAFWWSAPFNGVGKNGAAQMYHFDLDRIKFLKFFFYITDVDADTGPHCYVKGSHLDLPKQINRDGRFEDQEIEKVYGSENLIEITGKKGSIIAVDTRGFHKGKELLKGKRLLFQIQFSNSLFGQESEATNWNIIEEKYLDQAKKYSHTYSNIS
ncbi:phytanoyl-CoA dioxygenase family protein [Flavobacterium pedocola]